MYYIFEANYFMNNKTNAIRVEFFEIITRYSMHVQI